MTDEFVNAIVPDDLYCVRCGQNLRGVDVNGSCPVCTANVAESLVDEGQPAAPPPVAPPAGMLDQDWACVHCGYNLRGLDVAGNCPECFAPIASSISGNNLRFADRDWLKKLKLGTVVKLWNMVLGLLIGLATGIIVRFISGVVVVVIVLHLASSVLGLWATFLITTQEPSTSLTEDPLTLRKVVRTCAVFAFIGGVAGQTSQHWLVQLLALLLGAAGIVVLIGELVYLRRFALRVPNLALAKSTRTVMWGMFIMMVGAFVVGLVAAVLTPALLPTPGTAPAPPAAPMPAPFGGGASGIGFAFLACFIGILGLVFGIWYLVLLVQYKNLFSEAIQLAEQTHSHHPQGPPAAPGAYS